MKKFLPLAAVCEMTGAGGKGTLWAWRATRGFPEPVKVGGKALWIESEIEAWLDARIAERDTKVRVAAAVAATRAVQREARA